MNQILQSKGLHGVTQFAMSAYWFWSSLQRYLDQKSNDIVFIFMYPNWMLFTNMAVGIIGIVFSFYTISGRVKYYIGFRIVFVAVLVKLVATVLEFFN